MKTKAIFRGLVVATGLALAAFAARSDDIDLYTGGADVTGATSNVLIVLDSSTNWANAAAGWTAGKQGEAELESLRSVLSTLPGGVNVGLLMATNEDGGGGYVRYSIREMEGIVGADCSGQVDSKKGVFCRVLKTMQDTFGNDGANEDKINAGSVNYDALMNSAFRYFNGKAPWLHNPAPKIDMRDFAGNVNNIAKTLGEHSLATVDAPKYTPPANAGQGCAKNFIIFIGNGYPNPDGTAQQLIDGGALLNPVVVPDTSPVSGGDPTKFAEEWARFLHDYGVQTTIPDPDDPTNVKKLFNKVITYTIDVCSAGTPNTCDEDQARLLGKMASEGGGRYFRSTSQEEIRRALALIFAEIQAVNSQFAAAALPVSVTTKGTFANQVYVGVFKPDANAQPRWYGNLKAYKFAGYCDWDQDRIVDDGEILSTDSVVSEAIGNKAEACQKFCDSNGDTLLSAGEARYNDPDDPAAASCAAIALLPFPRYDIYLSNKHGDLAENQKTDIGFIAEGSQSFWTHDSTFWNFQQTTAAGSSDNPDGPNVERGGAAQRLRDQIATTNLSGDQAADLTKRIAYTCLTGSCDSSLQRFDVSNNDLKTRLQSSNTPKTITGVSRSGDTLTVTTSSSHNYSTGNLVTITGVTPGEYNLDSVAVTDVLNATQFKVQKVGLELPPVAIAAKLTVGGGVPVSGIQLLGDDTARAFLVGATADWLGKSVAIDGVSAANSAYLGGVVVVTGVAPDGSYFDYTVRNLPGNATTPGSAKTTGPAVSLASVTRNGNRVIATAAANLPNNKYDPGTAVTVTGTVPDAYQVANRPIISCPESAARVFCYRLLLDETAGLLKATLLDDLAYDVSLVRVLGDTTATVTLNDTSLTLGGIGVVAGSSISIAGTSTAYDGDWIASAVATPSFSIGPVTLTPVTPGIVTGSSQVKAANYVDPVTLIEWTLGKENGVEDENLDGVKSGYRASIHGDVLHSRPLMIQYPADSKVVGFYGSNDGFLRAISAGLEDTEGTELWSFIPPEFIPNVNDAASNNGLIRLYNNVPPIRYPHLQCSQEPAPALRNYFWDGAITQGDSEALELMGGKRIIYATMRRGGRTVYALDVTDRNVPKVAWKFGNATPVPGSLPATTFSDFGQSWSEAKVVVFKRNDSTRIPVVVMGGGYNGGAKATGEPEEDDRPSGALRGSSDGSITVGRGIYLIHAATGPAAGNVLHLKPPAGFRQFSIPSDVTTADTDLDGYPDRLYAVDSGGNVYRWQLTAGADPFVAASWSFKRVASVADSGSAENRRKFISRPAAMPINTPTGSAFMVLFGSGDREKPLANKKFVKDSITGVSSCTADAKYNTTVACSSFYTNDNYFSGGVQINDRFYGVLDREGDSSVIAESDLTAIVRGDNTVDGFSLADSSKGWFLDLLNNQLKLKGNSCPKGEEKLVDQPVFSGGYIKFATNAPRAPDVSSGICTNLGQARQYIVNPLTGLGKGVEEGDTYSIDAFSTALRGDGLPPSITSGVVKVGERYVKFDTRGAGGTERDAVNASPRRNRVYWYYQVD